MANIQLLVVGGGGGSEDATAYQAIGGGGGGGVLFYRRQLITAGSYTVTVGEGGNKAAGDDSYFGDSIRAYGGGKGQMGVGGNGACGGGGGTQPGYTGGTGNQGSNGGSGGISYGGGGGGGGAVTAGGDRIAAGTGGAGGSGWGLAISGALVYYGAGGGGGFQAGFTGGTGGSGVGGNGGSGADGTAGTANTGSGGGGGGSNGVTTKIGGLGGKGIVIVRYRTADFGTCTGGTISYKDGDTIHKFTSSGTFVCVPNEVKSISKSYVEPHEFNNDPLRSDANLKGYWRFEGNSNDELGLNNGTDTDISYTSTTAQDYGRFGQGALFNGSTSKIAKASSSADITNIFDSGGTACAWVYPISDGEANLGRILDKSTGSTKGWAFYVTTMSYGATKVVFYRYFSTTGGNWNTTFHTLPLNQWSHVAVTYTTGTSNDPTIYVNGMPMALTETTTPSGTAGSDSANTLNIGNRDAGDRTWDGYMDDICLFNRVLTAAEIMSLASRQPKKISKNFSSGLELSGTSLASDANLKAYWKFEGNSLDETASNVDGTDTNITYGTSYGKFGQGASFNGASSYITLGSPSVFDVSTGDFTTNCWLYMYSTVPDQYGYVVWRFDKSDEGANRKFIGLGISGTTSTTPNSVSMNMYNAGGSAPAFSPTSPPLEPNRWYMVTCVRYGSTGSIYFNGCLKAYAASGYNVDVTNATNVLIMGKTDTNVAYFNGKIDDLSFFNRALTATEIIQLYSSTKKIGGLSIL